MGSFPLLRLDFVARQEVLSNFKPHELLYYSTCSERAKNHVRVLKKKKFITMNISTDTSYGVFLDYDKKTVPADKSPAALCIRIRNFPKKSFENSTLKVNGKPIAVDEFDGGIHISTYWDKPIEGLLFWADYISDIFRYPIIDQNMNDEPQEDRRMVLEWHKNRKIPEVRNFKIISWSFTEDDIAYIFDNIKITGRIDFHPELIDTFQYNFTKTVGSIFANYGNWITVDNLIEMNCRIIEIRTTLLSNQDLNKFVQYWINGGLPKLEYINLEKENLELSKVLDGIDYEKKPETLERRYENEFVDQFYIPLKGGFDVNRNDNTIATIEKDEKDLFQMMVWPK